MKRATRLWLGCLVAAVGLVAADTRQQMWLESTDLSENSHATFYWKQLPVGETAQLLTLFCHACAPSVQPNDTPLVAVLRDTLGSPSAEDSRISYVWLLTYAKSNVGQRILGAIPFFYWSVRGGTSTVTEKDAAPLLNLTAVQHPVAEAVGRNILQWVWLDPSTTPIRATSRAYKSNDSDRERMNLEEAISYLREAPSGDASGLTTDELNTVIARLELRKRLLGGLASQSRAAKFGEEANFEQERVRSRNWELLRQSAERTGLIFEPIDLAGTTGQYAMLWFPMQQKQPVTGAATEQIWKLLNIKDPWTDDRLKNWRGFSSRREVDGAATDVIPLGMYNLNYPKLPLLVIDFRDSVHIRRHEMTQRTINEITSGVIGISHFTNWYYYVAADLYGFVAGRHGAAMDQAERLDCYAEFRVHLALDTEVEPTLRNEMRRREDSFAVNPLESSPAGELAAASERFRLLETDAQNGNLEARLDRDRRAELAADQEGATGRIAGNVLHEATFSLFTKRAPERNDNLEALSRYRDIQYNLAFLNLAVKNGTQPEVAYSTPKIQDSLGRLSSLLEGIPASDLRRQAVYTIERVRNLSQDAELRRDCSFVLAGLEKAGTPTRPGEVAAAPRSVSSAATSAVSEAMK